MAQDGIGLQEIDAGANACSLEWCPVTGLESYVACCTYLLETTADADADPTDTSTSPPSAAGTMAAGQVSALKGVKPEEGGGQTRSGSIVVHKVGLFALPLKRSLQQW